MKRNLRNLVLIGAAVVLSIWPATLRGSTSPTDLVELVDDPQLVNIATMENQVDAGEGLEDLRPELRPRLRDVSVGDQTDAHLAESTGK